jgi:DME family drug/metabolite transporter
MAAQDALARQHLTGTLMCLFAAIAWGTTGTAAAFAPDVSPLAIGAAAMGFGGLLQAFVARRGIRQALPELKRHRRLLLSGAVCVAIYPLAFYASMRLAGIENRLDGQRLTGRWAIGAAIGLAGIVLLSLAEGGHVSTGHALPLGVALGLTAGATYALYSWTAQRMMRRAVPPRVAMGATFGLGGALLMPVLLFTGGPFLQSAGNLAVGAYMALVPMFLGYLAFGAGLARVSASTATTTTLFEPAVAAVLAVYVVGENLPVLGWFGVGLIALCLVWTSLPAAPRRVLRQGTRYSR